MPWQYTPFTGPVFLVAVLGLAIAAFVLQYRDRPGARPLAALLVGGSLWSFADGMKLATAGADAKLFWAQAELAIMGLLPVIWLLLVLEYVGEDDWLTRPKLAVLLAEPLAFAAVTWGAPGLVFAEVTTRTPGTYQVLAPTYGSAYFAHVVYSYTVVLVGGALLVKMIFVAERLYRTQATALLVAMFLPASAKAAYVLELFPPVVDPTSVAFLLSGVLVTVAILRSQLLEVVPVAREVARDEVLENLGDRVIVLDERERIADVNPAAARLLDCSEDAAIGRDLADLLPEVSGLLAELDEDRSQAQLSIETDAGVRYFDVRISPLRRAHGAVTGTLVSLRDVTTQRQRRQRLDVLNRLLRHNLRNEMNVISGNAQLVRSQLVDDQLRERVERIEDTALRITDQSDKVGQVARTLDAEASFTVDLADAVREEVVNARERYPGADIDLDVGTDLDAEVGHAVGIALDELVANGVEHNDADPTVEVRAWRDGQFAVVEVADDGPGIDDHELTVLEEGEETALKHGSGVGLWVVYWIVEGFGGRLQFRNREDGCTAVAWLPIRDGSVDDEPDVGLTEGQAATPSTTVIDGVAEPEPPADD